MFRCGQKRAFSKYLRISNKVREALNNGEGVVALESTVITHGLPFPHNLSTARELEDQVRQSGSVPATIALLNGEIHVGLDDNKLEDIASSRNTVKVSTRDIAKTLVRRQIGGTTVASTMKIAHAAGIRVFATGGIGGVHRGADQTFDVSADLQELSKTPVCVVCSGVKSILDIPKTVEYLETHSVNCVVYGDENVFPSFFTRKSNRKGQFNTTDLDEVVKLLNVSNELGLPYGTILACPIPKEFAADGNVIQEAIDIALREAEEQGIASQYVTPFILAKVNELTKGSSMKTNIALLKNNARIAGQLAQKLREPQPPPQNFQKPPKIDKRPKVVSIGATIVDFEAITRDDIKEDGGSYTGEIVQRMGGVARNHADALARLGCDSIFLSAVGKDSNAEFFRKECQHFDISRVQRIDGAPTCTYLSMNIDGNIKYGVTTCEPLLKKVQTDLIEKNEDVIRNADYVLIDSNLPTNVIAKALETCQKFRKQVWFEPTDIKKVRKIFETGRSDVIHAASPNANEFLEWAKFCGVTVAPNTLKTPENVLYFVEQQHRRLFMPRLQILVVSLAHKGTAVIYRDDNNKLHFKSLPPAIDPNEVVSASGAGDCFNSGLIAGLVQGKSFEASLEIAQKCANYTLQSTLAVSDKITNYIID